MNQLKLKIDAVKKYWKENKTLLIIIIVMFFFLFSAVIVWYTDTSKLEIQNQLLESERKQLELDIKLSEAKIIELGKEKDVWKDSVELYRKDKMNIKKEQFENRKKFTSDLEKAKKETTSEDQIWWDENGKRLIKKWGL